MSHLADENAGFPGDVVGFKRMADGLVDQNAPPAVLHDDVHAAGRRVLGLQHGDGFAGAGPGHLLGGHLVENLDARMAAEAFPAHMGGRAVPAERLDDEENERQFVAEVEPLAVGDDAAADLVVIVDGGHPDPGVVGQGGVIGPLHDVQPLFVGHLSQRHLDRDVGRPFLLLHGNRRGRRAASGDGRGRLRGAEKRLFGDFVGIGESRLVSGDDPDSGPAADAGHGALEFRFLHQDVARDPVFGVDVNEVAARFEGLPDHPVQNGFVDFERLRTPARLDTGQHRGGYGQNRSALEAELEKPPAWDVRGEKSWITHGPPLT